MELIKAVLPVITMLLVGMLMREKKLISQSGIAGLQALVMNVTLPAALFGNFYKTSVSAKELVLPLTMFVAVAGGIFLGKALCRLFRQKNGYLPFMLSGYEAGMLGFALMTILAGNITSFAMLDIGQDFAIFTVYLAMLKATGGEKQSLKDALKGMAKTPVLIAIIAGVILGMSGLGGRIAAGPAGPVVDTLCSFVSAPTSAVILVVIGYRMYFKGLAWGRVLKACAIRLLEQGIFAAIVLIVYSLLGGTFTSRLVLQSAILMFILPPPYILPLYIEGEENKEFYSSALSVYTLFTIIGFIIMVAVSLA